MLWLDTSLKWLKYASVGISIFLAFCGLRALSETRFVLDLDSDLPPAVEIFALYSLLVFGSDDWYRGVD